MVYEVHRIFVLLVYKVTADAATRLNVQRKASPRPIPLLFKGKTWNVGKGK